MSVVTASGAMGSATSVRAALSPLSESSALPEYAIAKLGSSGSGTTAGELFRRGTLSEGTRRPPPRRRRRRRSAVVIPASMSASFSSASCSRSLQRCNRLPHAHHLTRREGFPEPGGSRQEHDDRGAEHERPQLIAALHRLR